MADDGPQAVRGGAAGVPQVDLVVVPARGEVLPVPLLPDKGCEPRDALRLVIVGSPVEELGAQPLLPPPQIGPGQVRLRPLPPQLLPGPGEDRLVHEVRLADEGDPAETALVRQGPAVKARLVRPPQALQRRHHVLEVARQGPPSQLAHLHREAQAVQQLQGLPVAGGGVGVPRPLHREKHHLRHPKDGRPLGLI